MTTFPMVYILNFSLHYHIHVTIVHVLDIVCFLSSSETMIVTTL